MNVFMGILGVLIAVLSLLCGIGIYAVATNAIQQIYAALLMITAVLGLVMAAVSAGAATIHDALTKDRESRESAARANEALINTLRDIADRRSLSAGAAKSPPQTTDP